MTASLAVVVPDLRLGGAQRVLLRIAAEWAAGGDRVQLISLLDDGDLSHEIPHGVDYRPLLRSRRKGLRLAMEALPRLVARLREDRPDGTLSSMTGTNLLASVAHGLAGRPGRLVLREAVSPASAGTGVSHALTRMLYRRADAVVAVSEGVRAELLALGLPPAKVHAIPNLVDADQLRVRATASPRPLPPDAEPYLVSVGRLVPQKGHDTLLRAFAASGLAGTHRLAIVGDGPLKEALLAQAEALGIGQRVMWLGALANPFPTVAGAVALVLASRWEGYPNVLLEALALGVPVVATDAPCGASEVLARGRYGALVPVDDVQALAAAMRDVAEGRRAVEPWHEDAHAPAAIARAYRALMCDGH